MLLLLLYLVLRWAGWVRPGDGWTRRWRIPAGVKGSATPPATARWIGASHLPSRCHRCSAIRDSPAHHTWHPNAGPHLTPGPASLCHRNKHAGASPSKCHARSVPHPCGLTGCSGWPDWARSVAFYKAFCMRVSWWSERERLGKIMICMRENQSDAQYACWRLNGKL